MRSLLFLILSLFHFTSLKAQDLSGKWKGYFIPNSDPESRLYSYEVDINENENHELSMITYSNLPGNFSAKAIATGFYSVNTKLVSINETKFEDIDIVGDMQACLMMNFLTFTNNRGRGILQGTYISNNIKGNRDCGGGKVYLEKETLINNLIKTNKKNATTKATIPAKITTEGSGIASQNKPIVGTIKSNTKTDKAGTKGSLKFVSTQKINDKNSNAIRNSSPITAKQSLTTNAAQQVAAKTNPIINSNTSSQANIESPQPVIKVVNEQPITTFATKTTETNNQSKDNKKETLENNEPGVNNAEVLPWVLLGRENKLIKRIVTTSKKISLDLYDNGTIDNDTIIIYDNNKLIANLKRLSYKAIHIELEFNSLQHDIIIVAHNMGTIPPNTALVVLNDANTRQEFFITTTNKVNAKFEFVYKPTD